MSINLRSALGILLIIFGVIAVPVPVLPGLPLVVAGTALLGHQHPLVRPWRTWLTRKGVLREGKQSA